MSIGLEAIANELQRLQRDGVNRVFVEDDTMQLLMPDKDVLARSRSPNGKSTPPTQNRKLLEEGEVSSAQPVKTVTKTVLTTGVALFPRVGGMGAALKIA